MEMELIRPDRTSLCTWKPDVNESPHTTRTEPVDWNKVLPDILHAIGGTPMVKLNNILKDSSIKCEIFAKCEYLNPGGSVKDRIAYRMVQDAEEKGILKPGYTIIEPTSGNTGIGLAMVAAVRGYRCIIVMPEKMSNEKVSTLRALGAEIVRTPTEASWDSPESHIAVSQKLQKEIPNSVILDQYTNPGNPLAHYDRTATEIWKQCDGKIDYFVGGAGTGGTISGIGRKLKELSPETRIIAVDPRGSILARPENLNKGGVGFYEVEGIGYDFIPTVLDHEVVDEWIKTEDCDALNASRMLIRKEGLLCGGSSGTALVAALQIAKDLPEGKRVVVLLPDGVRNYMTKFLSDHWMEARGFKAVPEPIKENKWWWNLPVSSLSLKKSKFLNETATCQDALNILEETNAQQLLVSNDDTHVEGVIVKNSLMSRLISGTVKPTDCVSKAMLKSFPKVTSKTSLGLVSRVLEQDSFVVVVLEDPKDNRVLNVISQSHVLNFITGNNGMIVANNHSTD